MNTRELPPDHPLRSAVWIWPEGYMYLYNLFAQFRRDFDLEAAPEKAPFFITADKAYKLYVNGEFICRGPARGFQSHWPFDEVDLAPHLAAGHNWIAVEAYTPGISTFQYIHQTQAGLLCAARWGEFELVTDASWTSRRPPGYETHTARYSIQMDFQEHVDARLQDRDWITSATPPEGWNPRQSSWGQHSSFFPFGRPPWDNVEPRGIPLMREEIMTPVAVTAEASGRSAEGYDERENVSWGWAAEGLKIADWRDGSSVKAGREGDWFRIDLQPTGEGEFRAVTVDLGRMIVGNLLVEAEGAAGGEVLDFQHDQCLRDGRPAFHEPGNACWIGLGNRIRPAEGRTEHEFFHVLGFRHVTVIARDLTRPVTLRLKARAAGYPFTMNGGFRCSDETLNDIHSACRSTQQLCALDAYVDTPWREQAQWWGDARVQARNTFYLDGDSRLLARGVRSIAGQSTLQGLTYGHAPTIAHGCILPDFSLTWILTIWDHYWQTASIGLFEEQWPRIEKVLSYFHTPDARSPEGLLRHDRRLWYFGDWADLFRGEIPTFLNLWCLLTLRRVVEMLRLAGRQDDAKRIEDEANSLAALVMEKLYDREAKMFRDGIDGYGRPASSCSVHEQTLALMLGLAPDAHETMIERRLLPYLRSEGPQEEEPEVARPSAFWSAYTLGEMAARGYGAEVVDFIRRKWSPMLSTGTTWEGFEWDETSGSSCSHAWTAHPSYHFVNVLAGVTQEAAGWKAIRFAPCFAPGIDRVEAVVPSPLGEIKASWKREGGEIAARLELPTGVEAEVDLPGRSESVAGGRVAEFAVKAPGRPDNDVDTTSGS
jgi:hypothetical protein